MPYTLHARNFKPVVILWKPFCYLCVRLRRNWNIRTSLIDAFASCILLSYSKIIDISLALISPNPVYGYDGTPVYQTVHYDLDTIFLSPEHQPLFIVAIILLFVLGLFPPLLLILYPFRWFQKLLNALRVNKLQSLYIFVDAFQGCYKNGTGKLPERRYFAGFYFVFRIAVFFVTSRGNLTLSGTATILACIYGTILLLICILQPYKKAFYNYLDAGIFFILTFYYILMTYQFNYAQTRGKINRPAWYITYIALFVPILYMIVFVLYWILTRFRARCCPRCFARNLGRYYAGNDPYLEPSSEHNSVTNELTGSVQDGLEASTDSLPDRLNNPLRYSSESQPLFKRNFFAQELRQPHQYGATF